MKLQNVLQLLILGMLWGISFLFIKQAVPGFGAVALMSVRVVLAAAILLPLVLIRRELAQVFRAWPSIALMGVLHYAIPFNLFAWSMQIPPVCRAGGMVLAG